MDARPERSERKEPDDALEALLAECLERFAEHGDAALDAACANRPSCAAELRARFGSLARLGLLPAVPAAGRDYPERLGDFRLLTPLGGGGMGVVYLARQESLQRTVALKLLRKDQLFFKEARERFRREAGAIARLQHPSIVPVHAFGEQDGVPYLALEFVPGCTLAEVIAALETRRDEELSGRDVAAVIGCAGQPGYTGGYVECCFHLARQIAEALAHAHERGVLHRDVKPSNVMLTPDGRALLLDFGLARDDAAIALTSSFAALGSLPYAAPEQVRGRRDVDARADVYGLGATLYELLARRPPFEWRGGRDPAELRGRILAGQVPPLRSLRKDIARDAATVVMTALELEPELRYRGARELARDLDAVLSLRPIEARKSGRLRAAMRWVRRNRSLAAAVALAFLLVTVLPSALFLMQHLGEKRLKRAYDDVRAERDAKDKALGALQRQRDREVLARMLEATERLWPAVPARLAGDDGIDAWLAGARPLLARFRAGGGIDEAAQLAPVVASIEERRAFALDLARRTIGDAHAAWSAAIAGIEAAPAYRGLKVSPQMGLLPLGADPVSGLYEFALLASGEAPERGGDGRLRIREESAVVLVLLPGGTFPMGSWKPDALHPEGTPNVDVNSEPDESPVHDVALDPFLLGKHEMTQAQWLRLSGSNPSAYRPGDAAGERAVTALHPVESVSRDECLRFLGHVGLTLPTEAQWEYAARGGTTTPWWCGAAPESIGGNANLADVALHKDNRPNLQYESWLDDGFPLHAPVGSFAPNPFGLHDILGNVREWCLDGHGLYTLPVRSGDGLLLVPEPSTYITRDGAFFNVAALATSAERSSQATSQKSPGTGVRGARRLDP